MSDGVLYAGSLDKHVLGIDATAHTKRFEAVAQSGVFCVVLGQEAGTLYVGTETGLIQSWNSLSDPAVELGSFRGHERRVSQLLVKEADQRLWSSSHDGTVREWDLGCRTCLRTLKVCEFQVSSFVLCGSILYAATWDSTVRGISTVSGECVALFKGHEHIILGLAAGSEGERLYSASGDHTALRWDVGASSDDGFERKSSMLYKGHIDAVMCLHILVLEDFIAEATEGAESESPMSEEDLAVLQDPCMPAVMIITGSDDRSIRLFDAETGQCLLVLVGHTDAISSFVVENGVLYSAAYDHSIRSWQLNEALIRIQMRRTLKLFEKEKMEAETVLEESSKKKKGKKKGKKKK